MRRPQGVVAERIASIGEDAVCTSIIVAAEMRYGAERRGSARLTAQMEAILEALAVVPFETPADIIYGSIRTQLERTGTIIGGNDLLIAAHAIALECALVTDNTREFSRVEGNWLR